jgi:hypothetical protein
VNGVAVVNGDQVFPTMVATLLPAVCAGWWWPACWRR